MDSFTIGGAIWVLIVYCIVSYIYVGVKFISTVPDMEMLRARNPLKYTTSRIATVAIVLFIFSPVTLVWIMMTETN